MSREEKLNIIFSQFDKSAKQFCEDTNGIFCEISSTYKGEEKPQNLQYRFAKIFYNSFAVKFTYTAHGMLSVVNSILSCSIYLDKTDDAVEIPLPLATDYCNIDIATPMCIPFITNEKGMIQAFNCIGSVLGELLDEFAKISYDPDKKTAFLTAFADEMKVLFEIDSLSDIDEYTNELIANFFALRFSSAEFINYIKGNKSKAAKQLKKIKKLTGYEKRIIEFCLSDEQPEFPDLSAVITNLETYNENGAQKASFKEFFSLLVAWFALTLPISAVYTALYFILVGIEGWNSVYLLGPIYSFPYCIIFGFITAIAASYFSRFKFYKWLYKKDYERYTEMDCVVNGGGSDKLMKNFIKILVIFSIAGCLLFSKWNLNFLSDGFVDNSKFFSLKGEYHSYSEIEKVYYKPDRVNDFDQVLDYPSYVVVLKNGKKIDLYEHGEITDYEAKLLDHLSKKGVKIERPKAK